MVLKLCKLRLFAHFLSMTFILTSPNLSESTIHLWKVLSWINLFVSVSFLAGKISGSCWWVWPCWGMSGSLRTVIIGSNEILEIWLGKHDLFCWQLFVFIDRFELVRLLRKNFAFIVVVSKHVLQVALLFSFEKWRFLSVRLHD